VRGLLHSIEDFILDSGHPIVYLALISVAAAAMLVFVLQAILG
jgi:hypothetical protein